MTFGIEDLNVLDRRRIEATVLGPMLRAFQSEIGEERANDVAQGVLEQIAREQGSAFRERVGSGDLEAFAGNRDAWRAGGALETSVLASTRDRYDFDVSRCRYAEMYRELGCADLGMIFSCGRDFSFAHGFNPDVRLTRTQTIMEGAPFCNFRYRLGEREDGEEATDEGGA